MRTAAWAFLLVPVIVGLVWLFWPARKALTAWAVNTCHAVLLGLGIFYLIRIVLHA